MAVTKGKPFLNLDSDRDSKFYNDYLARNELIINNGIKDVISCRRDVINYLEDQRLPQEIKNDLIKKMKQALKYEVIPSTEFDWISSSDRASYWVWGVLKIADFNYLGYSSIRNPFPDLPQGYTFYDWIVFNKTPSSTPERIDAIVEFFDRWKCAPEMKKELLQKLKIYWKGVTNMPDPFSWLDQNDEKQCEWAWGYICKIGLPHNLLLPVSPTEKYHSIYAAFDLWDVFYDTKKLFLITFKKAWDQKKYRNKQTGRKPLNTYLQDKTKKKLDTLAKQRGQRIHETLEWLINQEYDNNRLPSI